MKINYNMISNRHSYASTLFDKDNNIFPPHTLIELSNKSYVNVKDNMIELGSTSVGLCDGSLIQWYDKFYFGGNILTGKQKG